MFYESILMTGFVWKVKKITTKLVQIREHVLAQKCYKSRSMHYLSHTKDSSNLPKGKTICHYWTFIHIYKLFFEQQQQQSKANYTNIFFCKK
jgi:hypothetical protein